MKAMIVKEFRQLRRDRRTVALLVGLPILLLVVFGYAAKFDVTSIDTTVVGPNARAVAATLPRVYKVANVAPRDTAADATEVLRNSDAQVAVVATPNGNRMLIDGTDIFIAQSALRQVPAQTIPEVLFNPTLNTAYVMVPALIGLILLFVGTVITSVGVVREREQGTLEQLAVMPLRPIDVTIGKIAPYFLVGVFDLVVITLAGIWLFNVPFVGSIWIFCAFGLVFLFVVLGLGVAISTVSRSQGEAIQLAIMMLLPQVMLSGMIFPLASMATGVRWIGYLLPLTWFVEGMRGVFLKGTGFAALALPFGVLVVMAIVVFGFAMLRFRRDLAPKHSASPDRATAAVGAE